MSINPPLLRVVGVHKRFGDFTALAGVDLQVAEGEVVVVIGPSGSGKSTLVRCVHQLEPIDAGAIYVSGEPSDVAFANADDDVARLDGMPVFRAWREKTGHGGTYREPDGGAFGKVAADWLRWQLLRDGEAAKTFVGADCRLCTNPDWHVKKKSID